MAETYRELCEEVAAWLKERSSGDINLTGRQIFEMHPRGELFPVFEVEKYMKRDDFEGLQKDLFLMPMLLDARQG